MTTLTITRGLPGSGKTRWAEQQVAARSGAVARVNRDDIRWRMFGAGGKTRFDHGTEQAVSAAQQAAVRALLQAGRDVIVDDTNLRLKFARAWADLAVEVGADLSVVDFLDVPVEECIRRDAGRPDSVGEDVIRGMHAKFLRGRKLPPVTPTAAAAPAVQPYVPPPPGYGHPLTWLVDIDGTLALMDGRGPYEWDRVGEDRLNVPVAEIVHALSDAGYEIVCMSGRDEECREQTVDWLKGCHVPFDALYMREAGDRRKDAVVKAELFDVYVRGVYDVRGVIDDRDQVVKMWRAMGLTVAQVAEGRF